MKFIKDLFTGLDGKTWAIGRVYSLPMLATGLAVPIAAIIKGAPLDFAALGVMYGGLGGGVMAMVWGTNPTEPPKDPPKDPLA
ncbi:MAG: hypothetical protein EBR62_07385 [Verrucomicrobia bacterium]|nr:hypothetical protein [Verrucomicrobiota bacterium]